MRFGRSFFFFFLSLPAFIAYINIQVLNRVNFKKNMILNLRLVIADGCGLSVHRFQFNSFFTST